MSPEYNAFEWFTKINHKRQNQESNFLMQTFQVLKLCVVWIQKRQIFIIDEKAWSENIPLITLILPLPEGNTNFGKNSGTPYIGN